MQEPSPHEWSMAAWGNDKGSAVLLHSFGRWCRFSLYLKSAKCRAADVECARCALGCACCDANGLVQWLAVEGDSDEAAQHLRSIKSDVDAMTNGGCC